LLRLALSARPRGFWAQPQNPAVVRELTRNPNL
jgi:hypothetical protein